MRSLYKYMLERNRCNHRDYHNLAVNGGDSANTLQHMQTLRRNGTNGPSLNIVICNLQLNLRACLVAWLTDHPVLMIMELIGNDICSPEHTPNTVRLVEFFSLPPLHSNQFVVVVVDDRTSCI